MLRRMAAVRAPDAESRWVPRDRFDWLTMLGIVAIAFVARSLPVLRGAGLDGYLGYDDGVYFSSAVALVHGFLPYRDFLLLHPPGLTLLLSPFAALSAVTDESTGFAVARLAFMVLGALNAVLVSLAAGQYGRRAGLFAGVLYAMWSSATRVERTTLLLVPETTLLLAAVLVLFWSRPLTTRRAVVGGMALGLSMAIQVWQLLPLVIVVSAVAWSSRHAIGGWRRPALGVLAGALGAAAAVCLPFLVVAPEAFARFVLLDQLARPDLGIPTLTRLHDLEGFRAGSTHVRATVASVVIGLAAIGAAATAYLAWRLPSARLWCVLLAVEVAYLLTGPVFFSHYSAWIAPAGAVVLGTAASLIVGAADRRPFLGYAARLACLAVVVGMAAVTIPKREGRPLMIAALDHDIRAARCVAADAPVLLLETKALIRDLHAGCQVILDPTGTSYDVDRGRLLPGSVGRARRAAHEYQRAMLEYYLQADAALFARNSADGLTASTMAAISQHLSVVVQRGSVTVRLTAHAAGG